MIGLAIIVVAIFIAIIGSNIRKDATPMANEMNLALATKAPGFSIPMLLIRKNQVVETNNFFSQLFFGGTESNYRKIPLYQWHIKNNILYYSEYAGDASAGMPEKEINIADVVFSIMENSTINTHNNNSEFFQIDKTKKSISIGELQALAKKNIVTETFYLGTDKYGRDMLSRILGGTIISLSVGLVAVVISLIIGIIMGAIAGYFKGWVDDVITWFINVIWSIPTLLLVIAITLVLGKGFTQIFIAVGLTMWVEVARITRGQFLSLREKEFVEAARALGYKPVRIIFKHILPNAISPLIVVSASNFASAILIEAGLSFLGVGAQPPMPSWGNIIKDHYGYIILDKAYLALIPGCAIMLLVLAFTLLGNGLRDALDTKIKI